MSSYLFSPANNIKFLEKAIDSNSYALIPDLEDSVPLHEKKNALNNLINFLSSTNINNKIILPRIHNSDDMEWNKEQINKLIKLNIKGFIIPSVEDVDSISVFYSEIKNNDDKQLQIIPLIESMKGINNMSDIINTYKVNFVGLGIYDLSLDLNIDPSSQISLIDYVKHKFVLTALSNKCNPIDSPLLEINNSNDFHNECQKSYSMGFKGKFAIHPSQVSVINETYNNTKFSKKEIKEILLKYEELSKKGIGAFNYKNNIIDLPVYLNLRKDI